MIRATVSAGSTMTLSPFLLVVTRSCLSGVCSAMSGLMFDLNEPVPTPMTIIASHVIPYAAVGLSTRTSGMALTICDVDRQPAVSQRRRKVHQNDVSDDCDSNRNTDCLQGPVGEIQAGTRRTAIPCNDPSTYQRCKHRE